MLGGLCLCFALINQRDQSLEFKYKELLATPALTYREASFMWLDKLVDRYVLAVPAHFAPSYSGRRRAIAVNLMTIINEYALEDVIRLRRPSGRTDLRARFVDGLLLWTNSAKLSQDLIDVSTMLRYAEGELLAASKASDQELASLAALAYAYCANTTPGQRSGDHHLYETRLQGVVSRFKSSVPERALRAASALSGLYFDDGRVKDSKDEDRFIRMKFPFLRNWRSYG